VGRRADRERTAAQAGHSDLATNRAQVPAETASWATPWRPALVDVPEESCQGILACDFFVAVTATFRMLYVFVVIEHGTRRLAHVNVTTHPSAAWTLQQLREVIADAGDHRYLIHDRDSIFARHLDDSIRALGLAVLRSPLSSPEANAICERVIGTIWRECLDWTIPMSEGHLRSILREWVAHYNGGRPHSALGPGVPGPPAGSARAPQPESRRLWTPGELLRAKSVLGGLHHEYSVRRRRRSLGNYTGRRTDEGNAESVEVRHHAGRMMTLHRPGREPKLANDCSATRKLGNASTIGRVISRDTRYAIRDTRHATRDTRHARALLHPLRLFAWRALRRSSYLQRRFVPLRSS
jgi:transposase InsO family protein